MFPGAEDEAGEGQEELAEDRQGVFCTRDGMGIPVWPSGCRVAAGQGRPLKGVDSCLAKKLALCSRRSWMTNVKVLPLNQKVLTGIE